MLSPPVDDAQRITSGRQFWRFALTVSVVGVAVQLALTAYYLGMGHAPKPHDLPVGVMATAAQLPKVTSTLEADGAFTVRTYPSVDAMTAAIRHRDIYGGVDLTAAEPHLYIATAAGPSAAAVLRGTYTTVMQQQTAQKLDQLAGQATEVPLTAVRALTAPPAVTDVVPLPADDRNGSSIGFLVQALALGGTIASTGLGQLIPRARRQARRGLAHMTTLIVYALGSAAIVLWSMSWFGVGAGANHMALFWEFTLVSLAITASTAGAVSLIGPAGALAGLFYFTIGTVISGASIPPEFLPAFGHHLGQALPTGAGVQAVRDSLYFPAVSLHRPLTTLALYAGLGCLVILVTNALPNRSDRTSEFEITLQPHQPVPPSTD
ncbi:membrane protein [Longispora fulva]|uniref:DUF3533 domain-containing protein n=1 Tax=Longispora fulva TaxID=619741 RepID=A0A8J7KKQ7_9ACTN|nr:ABC transporter permease [Longispora fulva]MBG6137016.1 hypothetical protein [Longispora fulva]GIG61630.1 membrane protein [Longispora fulva]